MASPVPDSYSTATGGAIYGGRSGLPAWLSDITAGTWGSLPNSTLSASGVGWSGANPGGTGGYQSVVNAWGGGVLNTVGCYYDAAFHSGTFMVIWGGGHGDYAGNEVYAYGPMESDSAVWHRLTDPTIPAANNTARIGGQPVARHSYDSLQFIASQNKMLSMIAAGTYALGGQSLAGDVFDFATNTWSAVDSGYASSIGSSGSYDCQGGFNASTSKAWLMLPGNTTKLLSFDVGSQSWTNYSKDNPSYASASKGAIDPAHNILVMLGASSQILVQDLAAPTSAIYAPTSSGTGPTSGKYTLEWDSTNSRFVAWNTTGTTVYFLAVPADPVSGTWVWTSASGSGGTTPANGLTQGTYGRFRFCASLGGVVLMPTATNPISFYRM